LTEPRTFPASKQLDEKDHGGKSRKGFFVISANSANKGSTGMNNYSLSIGKLLEKKKVALRQGLWFKA